MLLSDTPNIPCHNLTNGTCQLSYQHLTFIMFIDIVFDLKIAGVSAMKTGHKSVKQELLHTFLQILQQHGF